MRPANLLLRCYAEKEGNIWQAFCLDFTLAAQGDSFEEVKQTLEAMIRDYVTDALVGDDKEHANDLLSRKAPFSEWAKYYWLAARCKVVHAKNGLSCLFEEAMPMVPANHRHA